MFTGLILSGLLAALPQQPGTPATGTPKGEPAEKQDAAVSELLLTLTPGVRQPADPAAPRAAPRRKKIVCGMTLIFVDPQLDPDMTKPVPKDERHVATIRRYPPPACGKER